MIYIIGSEEKKYKFLVRYYSPPILEEVGSSSIELKIICFQK